jgi:hypothetical protein
VVYKWKRFGVLWTVTKYKNEKTSNIYFFNNLLKLIFNMNINPLMQKNVQYFFFIPSFAYTNKLDGLRACHVNFPCEKHDVLKSKPQTDIVWHWDLLIVIANTNLIGNLRHLNCIDTSVGRIEIRGNNIFLPRNLSFKIMASITFSLIF